MFRPAHAAYALAFILVTALAGCGGNSPPPTFGPPQTAPENPPPVAEVPQNALPPKIEQAPLTPPVSAPPPVPAYLNGKRAVALLLPLTGPNAVLGNDMLSAAQMAVVEMGDAGVALTPIDTRGTPDGAIKAAQQALAEGAKLIIGPLTAAEVEAVKPVVHDSGVNVLAFSNVSEVAGDGVYLMGFMPQQEVRRVVGYAHAVGLGRFAVLSGADAYGQLASSALQTEATADGAMVTLSETFQSNESDLAAQSQQLANSQSGFDALLLPEGGQTLSDVATQLSALQIGQPKVRLLGTGLWDTPGLSGQPILVGGWYAAPEPEARAGFEERFAASYGHAPRLLASLAYDAVALAAVLDRTKGGDFSAASLTDPSGFAGVNGIFRFLPDGTNERGLAVLQVEPNGSSIVSPAPRSFAAAQGMMSP